MERPGHDEKSASLRAIRIRASAVRSYLENNCKGKGKCQSVRVVQEQRYGQKIIKHTFFKICLSTQTLFKRGKGIGSRRTDVDLL